MKSAGACISTILARVPVENKTQVSLFFDLTFSLFLQNYQELTKRSDDARFMPVRSTLGGNKCTTALRRSPLREIRQSLRLFLLDNIVLPIHDQHNRST